MDSLSKIRSVFRENGCTELYAKILAENDNAKNQIYFGPNFKALSVLPILSVTKGKGKKSLFGLLDFYWLEGQNCLLGANGAKLIFYPQYPEVRFSGFLRGTDISYSRLLAEDTRVHGRVLFLGVAGSRVIGLVVSAGARVAKEVAKVAESSDDVLVDIGVLSDSNSAKNKLFKSLKEVSKSGWLKSCRRSNDKILPCKGVNCGGYTLEALLGISNNGKSEPDFMGWELKSVQAKSFEKMPVGRITLFTPEPDGGIYVVKGVNQFVQSYGYPDKNGKPNRMNFSSPHYFGKINKNTGLKIEIQGFSKGKITDTNGGVCLVGKRGEIAAKWNFSGLMEHWNKKHNKVCFVPSQKKASNNCDQFRYSDMVYLGEGSDFVRFLSALEIGAVYYDPGIHVVNGVPKRRSQFRVDFKKLSCLYDRFGSESLI
ncbi:MvaI/BcnI family restriction endonuclease [Bdellovibrio sp. GT3]|uniref:MvaI/BcnI family restriction endonuclease n=1 Tax=Bdellovibrio sp. GT3 TaxID=3136282 RepID=UPI0030F0BE6E